MSLRFAFFLSVSISCAQVAVSETAGLRGVYTYGVEVSSFRACGETSEYWAEGAPEIMAILEANAIFVSDQLDVPYSPVYVEIEAAFEPDAMDGFAAEYDGVLRIDAVTALSWTVSEDCK